MCALAYCCNNLNSYSTNNHFVKLRKQATNNESRCPIQSFVCIEIPPSSGKILILADYVIHIEGVITLNPGTKKGSFKVGRKNSSLPLEKISLPDLNIAVVFLPCHMILCLELDITEKLK